MVTWSIGFLSTVAPVQGSLAGVKRHLKAVPRCATPKDLIARPMAVEFQLVKPFWTIGKPFGAQEQHGRDEFSFGLRAKHRGIHDGKS